MIATSDRLKDRAHFLTTSANQKEVYIDLMHRPLASNVGRNPHLLSLVEEALESIELKQATMQLEQDMGRSVGYSELVSTSDSDTIFYARQNKTAGFTRFVKNRQTEPTQYITMNLCRDDNGDYEVTNVWIGRSFPAMPGEVDETKTSKTYWSSHAVVYNGQALLSNTLTKDCPY